MFKEADIPDCSGKVAIVTGGNSGIGKQTVAVLASQGAKVYLAARSQDKFDGAVDDIRQSHPASSLGSIHFLKLDLSTAKGAKEAADTFKSKESTLHLLFNNGYFGNTKGSPFLGWQWAVNMFGPIVFTYHLLDVLLRTAESCTPGNVRIINTSSDGAKQAPVEGIPLTDPTVGSSSTPFQCYGISKIGVILWTQQLARRYPSLWSFAPHPGPVRSELIRELGIPFPIRWILDRIVYKPVQYGALTQLFSATSLSLRAQDSGSYLVPLAKLESQLPHKQCYDDDIGSMVWDWNMNAMEKAGMGL